MNAQQEVEKLIGDIRAIVNNPKIDRITDQISVLCSAYMEPDMMPPMPLALSPGEHRMFSLLLKRKGQVVSRDALLNATSAKITYTPSQKLVDVRVCHIRKKLPAGYKIENAWGTGYRLVIDESVTVQ